MFITCLWIRIQIQWILNTTILFRRTKDQCYQRYTYSLRETIRKPNINIKDYYKGVI